MVDYNDGKWHGWNGGECPVHPCTVVEWKHRDDYGSTDNAGALEWSVRYTGIVAFRVIKAHKEPREFWIYPESGTIKRTKPACPHAIHVREVSE